VPIALASDQSNRKDPSHDGDEDSSEGDSLMGSLSVLVLLLALLGGVLVSDIGGFRSRTMRRKAEHDASLKGPAGGWVDADAGADALDQRYNRGAVAFGWVAVACAVAVFLMQLR